MKRFIAAIGLVSVLAPPVFAGGRTTQEQREQSLLARVTVYWASGGRGSDSYTRRHQCSTGVRLRVGHCAVDPHRIPYGSKVVLSDGVFTAVDTGGAVITRKAARRSGRTASERNALVIDRFFETKGQALSWANAHPAFMTVQVIPPNYSRATTAQRPQPARQPVPKVAAKTVSQAMQVIPPNYSRAATAQRPQPSRQPVPKVAAKTVPQTKRIASADLSPGVDRVRR
jgi:3D (Asp-Asp-Asp) domain-containing protein